MAINRALMNRQMYNMGGSSLETGAPDITLTGDMRPTYSAMRKQRLAYGGIAGLDGRKKYGIGSWFQENIMDPIKENPVTSAVVGAGLVNQFGLPDKVTEYLGMGSDVGQNFLGNLINRDLVLGDSGMFETGSDLPDLVNIPNIFGTGSGNKTNTTGIDLSNIVSSFMPTESGNLSDYLINRAQQEEFDMKQAAKFASAVGAGEAARRYVESKPRDTIPEDTTGIDIPTITAAARGTDAEAEAEGLRFLPPQVARAANGGRIGYANGMSVDELPYAADVRPKLYAADVNPNKPPMPVEKIIEAYMKSREGTYYIQDQIDQGKSMQQIINQMRKELNVDYGRHIPEREIGMDPGFTRQLPERTIDIDPDFEIQLRSGGAQGGRIGFSEGSKNYNEDPEYRGWKKMYEQNPDVGAMHNKHSEYLNFYNAQGKAQGGRIGYDMGGLGGMMASNIENDKILEALLEKYLDMGLSLPKAEEAAQEEFERMSMRPSNRVMAQEGGLMDLGGMEKDYREEGGFVPIGGKEKADDVPARLSKNEFVFTADAVRNAGGGDIDEGAAIMERMMKNLEQGGQVSEESQGLEGAREMFETSQRLEKRII